MLNIFLITLRWMNDNKLFADDALLPAITCKIYSFKKKTKNVSLSRKRSVKLENYYLRITRNYFLIKLKNSLIFFFLQANQNLQNPCPGSC